MTDVAFETIETQEDFGVAYELHQLPTDHRFAARIFVKDVDSGNVVSVTCYPTIEMARTAYAELVRVATA